MYNFQVSFIAGIALKNTYIVPKGLFNKIRAIPIKG